jgi:hypothetical protein
MRSVLIGLILIFVAAPCLPQQPAAAPSHQPAQKKDRPQRSKSFLEWLAQVTGLSATSSGLRGTDHAERGDLWVQPVEGGAIRRLTGDGGYSSPVFSPDDRSVIAMRGAELWSVPANGGKPVKLAHSPAGVVSLLGSGPDGVVVLTGEQIGTFSPESGDFSPFQPATETERNEIAMMRSSGRTYDHRRLTLFERNGVVVVVNAGHSREIAAEGSENVASWSQPSASHDLKQIVLVGSLASQP